MRATVTAVILLAFLQAIVPVPRKASDESAGRSQDVQKNADAKNSRPASITTNPQNAVTSTDEQRQIPTNANGPEHVVIDDFPRGGKDAWDKTYIVLTGILVFIGIGTLILIYKQTRETAKAAAAARDSVRLQETIQQQWVQVDGWRRHGGGSRDENPPRFSIAADISNPTNVPITVLGVTISVGGQTLTLSSGNVIAPSDPPIIAEFPIVLNSEQIPLYQTYKLVLIVKGEVVYVDAFQNHKKQPFGQACVFGPNNSFRAIPLHQM